MKNKLLRNVLVLAGICSFFALLLGIVNMYAGPVIEKNRARREKEALSTLIKEGQTLGERLELTDDAVVKGATPVLDGSKPVGMILVLVKDGYGGPLTILAHFGADGMLIRSVVSENAETPGFGKAAEEPWYMALFEGKGSDEPIPLTKSALPSDKTDSVSGATITFTAVSSALSAGSVWIKNNPEVFSP